ncbi:hypothetical protein Mapa_017435 [Marchantia paleacea]|nr:hypothetical protein Mapa_017435 [Marchantia paleacea]
MTTSPRLQRCILAGHWRRKFPKASCLGPVSSKAHMLVPTLCQLNKINSALIQKPLFKHPLRSE